MHRSVIAYLGTIIPFLIIDAVWLGFVATSFFQDRIGHLMADEINLPAAAGFYLLYGVGIVYFAVWPGLRSESARLVLLNGALFGFLAYGTYDMTNYAVLRDYPFSVVAVDMTWGAFLTAISGLFGYLSVRRLQTQ